MTVLALPADQRGIDIDSRRFASIENALVEPITHSDDSYWRLEPQGLAVNGKIFIRYERHQNGALLIAGDQDEGMSFSQIYAVLSYGGGRIVKGLAVRRGRPGDILGAV